MPANDSDNNTDKCNARSMGTTELSLANCDEKASKPTKAKGGH